MPNAFVDNVLIENIRSLKNDNDSDEEIKYPAYVFEANCLRIGITLGDLKERTYVSIMKVLFSFLDKHHEEKSNVRKATQKDIDKFMS